MRIYSFALVLMLLAVSCISTIEMVGKARPEINSSDVVVAENIPDNAELVGNISVMYSSNWTGEMALSEGIVPAKSKAAKVGANIIVIKNKAEIIRNATGYNSFSRSSPMLVLQASAYCTK